MINRACGAAGLPHIYPHQLRHTLATQAINRGMSLEAIAALLGHRSLDMTLRYAKIASRTVADEYFAVSEKVEACMASLPSSPPSRWPEDDPAAPRAPAPPRHWLHLLAPARLRLRVHRPPVTLRPAHPPDRRQPSIMISLTTITRIMPMSVRAGSGRGRVIDVVPLWYHVVMAMNLRLDDEDSALLKALAEAEHVSLHEAALRAIRRSARELAHTDRVREATAEMLDRWGEVLDRLGHA